MPNGSFSVNIAIAKAPIRKHRGTPSLGVDQHTGEEVGQAVVAVYWEHVCDVLVRADDDHAASLADHAAQVEDVLERR